MSAEETMIESAKSALEESSTPKEKLRNYCMSNGYVGLLSLGRMFRRNDDDKSGALNNEEIGEGIKNMGLDLTDDEIGEIMTEFDADGTGHINYEEFLEAIRPDMSEDRVNILEQAYGKLDESGDGKITIEDLKTKYDVTQHPSVLDGSETEDDVLGRFLNRFEGTTSEDGVLTKHEFMDYYCGISNSIDTDEYFVEMIKKCYQLEE